MDRNDCRLYLACKDYYDFINRNDYNPSKKKQNKILKSHNLPLSFYPLDISCQNFEHK